MKSTPKTNVRGCLISTPKRIVQGSIPIMLTSSVPPLPSLISEWKFSGMATGLPELLVPVIIYLTLIIHFILSISEFILCTLEPLFSERIQVKIYFILESNIQGLYSGRPKFLDSRCDSS